jgi:hypothetical protein
MVAAPVAQGTRYTCRWCSLAVVLRHGFRVLAGGKIGAWVRP